MGCGELLISLTKARAQGGAENPTGLAPEALEPGFPKCIWVDFFIFFYYYFLSGFMAQAPSTEKVRCCSSRTM